MRRRGLTLIELLVILVILAMMAVIVTPILRRKRLPVVTQVVAVEDRRVEYRGGSSNTGFSSAYFLVTDHGDYQVSQGLFMGTRTGHTYRVTARGRSVEQMELVE